MKCPSCGEEVKVYARLTFSKAESGAPVGTVSPPICAHCLVSGIGVQRLVAWVLEGAGSESRFQTVFEEQRKRAGQR